MYKIINDPRKEVPSIHENFIDTKIVVLEISEPTYQKHRWLYVPIIQDNRYYWYGGYIGHTPDVQDCYIWDYSESKSLIDLMIFAWREFNTFNKYVYIFDQRYELNEFLSTIPRDETNYNILRAIELHNLAV